MDGAWAEGRLELLSALREHGTKLIVDTLGWRFRYDTTLKVAKLRGSSWSPDAAVSVSDRTAGRTLIEASLRAQASVGADAYLVPGWMPDSSTEDLRGPYEHIVATAGAFGDVPARPLVLFVGGHTQGVDRVVALLEEVPHFISALYIQLSPIAPTKDGPSKLESMTTLYRRAGTLGFKVIAGHCGAVTPALRALGVDAADAGLAVGETFDRARAKISSRRVEGDESSRGGLRSRMYFSEIGRSLSAADVERLLAVPGAAAELRTCRLPCHRFRSGDLLEQAREHSLWARVADAQLVVSLPASMRATSVHERLRAQRSVLSIINGALATAGGEPLDMKPTDNHMAWISRALAAQSAA